MAPLVPAVPARPAPQAGFTLIEMLISFVLLVLAVTLAAQLLVEAAQMFTDVAGEQHDSMVPLALARIRNDVQGSVSFQNLSLDPLSCSPLVLSGGPNGSVVYTLEREELRRNVVAPDGTAGAGDVLMRQVTAWTCQSHGSFPPLLELDFTYRRRAVRRTPLAVLPAYTKPNSEQKSESLFLTLRGGGLGSSW
jgi:prepilin-type N-terminal cleavage/methylation domain-containing protein